MNIRDFGDPDLERRRAKQVRIAAEIRRKGKPVSAAEIEKQMREQDRNLQKLKGQSTADDLVANFTPQPVPMPSFVHMSNHYMNVWPMSAWITMEEQAPPKALEPELTTVEAITGWRRWSVEMFGSVLLSNNRTPWEPYKKLAAECKQGGVFGPKECRGIHCDCGIYAYKNKGHVQTGENKPSEVIHLWGEVYLWGRVVEHSKGWRAQFGYPKSLVDTGGIAQQVARNYGIKLIQK